MGEGFFDFVPVITGCVKQSASGVHSGLIIKDSPSFGRIKTLPLSGGRDITNSDLPMAFSLPAVALKEQ